MIQTAHSGAGLARQGEVENKAEIACRIEAFRETAANPGKAVRTLRAATGKKLIGCFPVYGPEELIYAAEMIPVGMWGGQSDARRADQYVQSFCCSVMRQNLGQGMDGIYHDLDGVVLPIYCDTMKCICENWKIAVPEIPVMPMVYPQNRSLEAGREYLKGEFQRILNELVRISGYPVSEEKLEEVYEIYEKCRFEQRRFVDVARRHLVTISAKIRHYILKAAYFMDKRDYTEKLRLLTDALEREPPEIAEGTRLVITGILAEPDGLLDLFEENGIAIICDDLAQESRQFRTLSRQGGSVLERMAGRSADQRGCSLLFEEQKSRGQMLIEMVEKHQADGVIVCMMKFCDPEEFDYPIYKKELEQKQIPLLYIEIEQKMDSIEQLRTRIQGFVELLKEKEKCF